MRSKKILSATLAAIMAVSALSATAFANGKEVTAVTSVATAKLEAESQTIQVQGQTSIPDIKVTLPSKVTYIANPYRLTVSIPTSDGDTTQVNSAIVGVEAQIINQGSSKISVAVTAVAKPKAGNAVVLSQTGKFENTSLFKDMVLFVEPGTYEAKTHTYKFNGAYNAATSALAAETVAADVKYADADVTALKAWLTSGKITATQFNNALQTMVTKVEDDKDADGNWTDGIASVKRKASDGEYKVKKTAGSAKSVTLLNLDESKVGPKENPNYQYEKWAQTNGITDGMTADEKNAQITANKASDEFKKKYIDAAGTGFTDNAADAKQETINAKGAIRFSGSVNSKSIDNWDGAKDLVDVDLTFNIKLVPNVAN